MAATLDQICTAIATTLKTYYAEQGVTDVNVYDDVPGQITTPCVLVEPSEGEYHQVFGGGGAQTEHLVAVHVIYAMGDRRSAQFGLMPFISGSGSRSVKAGIASDPTLGGVVKYADAERYRDYGTRRYNEVDYLMCTVEVRVQG